MSSGRWMMLATLLILPHWAFAQTVRIGVFTLFHASRLTLSNASGSTVLITGDGLGVILNNEGASRIVHLQAEDGRVLFNGHLVRSMQAASRDGHAVDFTLAIPGRIARHYRGILTITANQNELVPVVTMAMETAVASVVAAESPPDAPIEALKAQAVAARSFFEAGGHHGDYQFCDTTHCQFLREPPAPSSPASTATRDTKGLILTWHGEPLAAMYSSRCGGRTKALREIGAPVRGYPYFAVECAYCRRHPSEWTRAVDSVEAGKLANATERERLAVDRAHGWSAIPSNEFEESRGPNGVTVKGEGHGHGLGLCQYGAAGMAADGASFAEILRHYYPETELESITRDPFE